MQDQFRTKNLQSEQLFERFESQKDRQLRIAEQGRGIVAGQDLLAQQQRFGGQQSALDRERSASNIALQGRFDLERAVLGEEGAGERSRTQLEQDRIREEQRRKDRQREEENRLFTDILDAGTDIFTGFLK